VGCERERASIHAKIHSAEMPVVRRDENPNEITISYARPVTSDILKKISIALGI